MMRTAFIAVLLFFRFHDALGVAFIARKAARMWQERLLPSQPFQLPPLLESRDLELDSSTELRFGRDHHREDKGFGGLGYLPLKLEGLAERVADTLRSATQWAAAKDSNLTSKPELASLPEETLCLEDGTFSPKKRNRLQLGYYNQRGKRTVSSSTTDRSTPQPPAVSGFSGWTLRSALQATGATRGGATKSSGSWANALEGLKNGLASGLAAACVKAVLQPFDTMKTVQQFSTTRLTLLQAGRDLVARGGVKELYQGLGVTLVGSMPAVGIYFGLYQFVKKQMDAKENVSPYLSIIVSAGVGNFIASFFRVPYEVVKQRLQVGAYPNTAFALRSIYSQEGLWGFFGKGGITTQWARDIPYAMVTLLVYETLQKAAARRRTSGGASALENMVIGAVAGGTGSLVTNPMDMIKTRMMTSPESYAGPIDAAWTALRKEGPQAFIKRGYVEAPETFIRSLDVAPLYERLQNVRRAFMKGATPRLLHKIPANALFFVTYEFFRTLLGVSR